MNFWRSHNCWKGQDSNRSPILCIRGNRKVLYFRIPLGFKIGFDPLIKIYLSFFVVVVIGTCYYLAFFAVFQLWFTLDVVDEKFLGPLSPVKLMKTLSQTIPFIAIW